MKIKQAEFSRMAGVSRNAISKAIRAGRLKVNFKGKIDVDDPLSIEYLSSKINGKPINIKTGSNINKVVPKIIKKVNPDKNIEDQKQKTIQKNKKTFNTENGSDAISELMSPMEKRMRNLVPWKKGESGNPKGGKKAKRWGSLFNDLLSDTSEEAIKSVGFDLKKEYKGKISLQMLLAQKMITMAIDGNEKVMSMILDRMDGKAMQLLMASGMEQDDRNKTTEGISNRASELIAALRGTGS